MEDNDKGKADDKGEEQKATTDDAAKGSKYETTPVIERAREEREKLEAATKAQKEENDRTEQIMAKQALGGKADAGTKPEEPKKETDEEYADKVWAGTANP